MKTNKVKATMPRQLPVEMKDVPASRRPTIASEVSQDPSIFAPTHVTFPSIRGDDEDHLLLPHMQPHRKSIRRSLRQQPSDRFSISLHDQMLLRDRRSKSILTNMTYDSRKQSMAVEPKLAPTYQLKVELKFKHDEKPFWKSAQHVFLGTYGEKRIKIYFFGLLFSFSDFERGNDYKA